MNVDETPRREDEDLEESAGADAPVHGGEGDPLGEGVEEAHERAGEPDGAS